jgi:hypothetical protein
LEYIPRIESVTVVANAIGIPASRYPSLRTLKLVAASSVSIEFLEGAFETLETLHIETHTLTQRMSEIPPSILSLRLSVHIFPVSVLPGICLLPKIRHLSFEGCRLTYLPEAIGQLQTLESLSLRGNFMTIYNDFGERDGCMLPIRDLHALRYLDISDNVCIELGSASINLPDGLEVLDVRSAVPSYYNEPFYMNANLNSLKNLVTSRLPSRDEIQVSLQNLEELVYAPPATVRTAFQSMVALCTLAFPEPGDHTSVSGVEIPSSIDGLRLLMNPNGHMHLTDVMTYSNL